MLTTVRAALAATMLFGFYLYALAIAALFIVATIAVADVVPGATAAKLIFVALAVPLGILVATWRVARAPSPEPSGVVVSEASAPMLWAQVRQIAEAVGTRAPDEIRLIADMNAAVSEHTRWLGLIGGRRYLYLGVPLLQGLTVSQLRAVLAHEMGHYSGSHTRLGGLIYRGSDTMAETVQQVGPGSLPGMMLRLYHRVYLLVSLAVKRRQEVEADRAMVRIAGRSAAASALRELPVLTAAWGFYLQAYVAYGLDSGHAPTHVLTHFPTVLRARTEELDRIRASGAPTETSRWDSHPPIAHRIAMVEAEPDVAVSVDSRPATELLNDPDQHLAVVEAAVFQFGDRERVPMEQYSTVTAQYHLQREVDRVLRAVARANGGRYGLSAVFDEVAAGRWSPLVQQLYPDAPAEQQPTAAKEVMHMLLNLAAVSSGVADWKHSWSAPARLHGKDDEPLDLSDVATLAVAPETLPEAKSRLQALGIDVDAVAVVEQEATLTGAEVLAGLTNLRVNRTRSDMVILNRGLVTYAALPWYKAKKAPVRLYELVNTTAPESLTRVTNGQFIPTEEIVAVRSRRFPRRYDLTMHGGERVRIRPGSSTAPVGQGWQALDQVLATVGSGSAAIPTQRGGGSAGDGGLTVGSASSSPRSEAR